MYRSAGLPKEPLSTKRVVCCGRCTGSGARRGKGNVNPLLMVYPPGPAAQPATRNGSPLLSVAMDFLIRLLQSQPHKNEGRLQVRLGF